MHSCVYRRLTVQETQRLFVNACLSTSHQENKWDGEYYISPFLILDYLIGLMRIPYLYIEADKVYKGIQRQGEWKLNNEFLAVVASSAETIIWMSERKFLILGPRSNFIVQGICYLSRMVLYERAVYVEGRALIQMWKEGKKDRVCQKLKMQFVSHSAYLGWVTLTLITHAVGKGYSRKYMNFLHTVSVIFGGIASCYDPMPDRIRQCLKPLLPQNIV